MPVMASRVLDDLSSTMGSTSLHAFSTDGRTEESRPTKASISILRDAAAQAGVRVKSFEHTEYGITKGGDEDEVKREEAETENRGIRAQTQATTATSAAPVRTHIDGVHGVLAWQAARRKWTRPSARGRLPIRKCKSVERPGEMLRGLLGQTEGEFPNAIPLPLAIDLLGDAWEADGLYDP